MLLLWPGWHLVRLTPAETSCGQVCYYFSQVDLWSDVPPTLPETSCGQVCYYLCQVDVLSDIPLVETSCGQVFYYFSQVDLWLDIPPSPGTDTSWPSVLLLLSGWPLVRCTGQMYPLPETSCGQVCYSAVRLISGQMYPQRWGFGSGWHLVRLWVRPTVGFPIIFPICDYKSSS